MKDKGIVVVILAFAILLAGCQESQWGKGDPPAKWQETFGNDNMARLNYVQTQRGDKQHAVIYGVTIKDPKGKSVRKRGLIERVTTLEGLADRVKKIDANSPEDKAVVAMYEEIIALQKRVEALEEKPYVIKPYIYENLIKNEPNEPSEDNAICISIAQSKTVCSKHGELRWGGRWSFEGSNKVYCGLCIGDVARLYLDKHIVGMDPNE